MAVFEILSDGIVVCASDAKYHAGEGARQVALVIILPSHLQPTSVRDPNRLGLAN